MGSSEFFRVEQQGVRDCVEDGRVEQRFSLRYVRWEVLQQGPVRVQEGSLPV